MKNKQEIWEQKMDRMKGFVEPNILELVVALNLLGIHTIECCEGHGADNPTDGCGDIYPYVAISDPTLHRAEMFKRKWRSIKRKALKLRLKPTDFAVLGKHSFHFLKAAIKREELELAYSQKLAYVTTLLNELYPRGTKKYQFVLITPKEIKNYAVPDHVWLQPKIIEYLDTQMPLISKLTPEVQKPIHDGCREELKKLTAFIKEKYFE